MDHLLVEALDQGLPLEDIERLLAANPAAALADEEWSGKLPLHYAAQYGRADVVKVLLAAAPATAAAASTGTLSTPLHLAAREGRAAVVPLLLEAAPATALPQDARDRTRGIGAAAAAAGNRAQRSCRAQYVRAHTP